MNEDDPEDRRPPIRDAGQIGSTDQAKQTSGDMLSQSGAIALAKRLEEYWHQQGYPAARFWAVPIDERFAKVGTYELYRVVCNFVDGLPPVYANKSNRRE